MEKTYTYTKKQVSELLEITPNEVEKLSKNGTLTRVRKTPGNNNSTWLYSAEDIEKLLPEDCCEQQSLDLISSKPASKKWYQFWK